MVLSQGSAIHLWFVVELRQWSLVFFQFFGVVQTDAKSPLRREYFLWQLIEFSKTCFDDFCPFTIRDANFDRLLLFVVQYINGAQLV